MAVVADAIGATTALGKGASHFVIKESDLTDKNAKIVIIAAVTPNEP